MAVIRPVGALRGATYSPFIHADSAWVRDRRALVFAGRTLAVFSRPLRPDEGVEWARIGRTAGGVLVIDPGPFEVEEGRDLALELLLIEEAAGGRRDNRLVVDGPRLASAELDGHRWQRVSLALAPSGWARDVATRFIPGKDGLRQTFTLPGVAAGH